MITVCLRCGREKILAGGALGKYEGEKTNINYIFCPECIYVETALLESDQPGKNMIDVLKVCARDYKDKIFRDKNSGSVWVVNPDLPAAEIDVLFLEMKERLTPNLNALKQGVSN
jgi:hypothetical protein